jgi:hypothetical protein
MSNKNRGKDKVPVLNTPWRSLGEWRYSSTNSLPRHQMEVSGQLHALVALPPWEKTIVAGYQEDFVPRTALRVVIYFTQKHLLVDCNCVWSCYRPRPINGEPIFFFIAVSRDRLACSECALYRVKFYVVEIPESETLGLNSICRWMNFKHNDMWRADKCSEVGNRDFLKY